jgi:hypothetical protein
MLFWPRPRLSSALASVLAACVVLTAAGCGGHLTPLGPDVPPRIHHLRSPIILQAISVQPHTRAGRCPAGSAALPAGGGQCYRKIGTPMTITSAAVSSLITARAAYAHPVTAQPVTAAPKTPSGQGGQPTAGGFFVALPLSDTAALTTVTTTAYDAHGYLAISVAGQTWALPRVLQPFTSPQFQVMLPNWSQAARVQHILNSSG